ncbi:aminotransferase class I/II-fold pyridoxal phosphate-dependent enzyme [Granulicella sp. 5B5]|uniref:aminotransferase class I/II-fold pyridoxal phosphate-dependent enzyme n=1 Tax=Granulicella sp. 5B5 TaxID=1617967 RepID=UPI0015F4E380|nr:PLP-dependent aminotransferase family protein [Granulicella sp. 5B5]QMV17593.1 aminotransferase class I/II-fold pyridoxal phosphate-dependent enzyme [Granulicella sp. 5B5]
MIEMQYNFPLLPTQGSQWQQRLATAVAALSPSDADQLRPTFRQHLDHKSIAAKWLRSDPANTFITCGGHHGTLVSQLASGTAGKPIAVEAVTYTGILQQALMLASPLIALDYDAEGMTPGSLRAACQSTQRPAAVYTMPTVHNPLGCVASLVRREAIVAVARDFDLLIIEDDAYGYMAPDAPASYAVLAPERAFYVRGLAKSYAPATRTGFLVAPPQFTSAIEMAISNTATGTSLPHNAAALSLIADGSLDALIQQKLNEGAQRNAAARAVLGDAATPGARSAWHLWVKLPNHLDASTAQRLCEERGALVSGAQGFTVPGTPIPHGLRIALGGELDPARTLEGVHIVADVLHSAR